ncbi:MAG: hypothetical protein A2X59_00065 [Nitrospirae bacterium GWC2_42_7]|nr:MAG: hypothetical protein A2X59_00065 [Nitrospirae bacterium GWC2_42_7]
MRLKHEENYETEAAFHMILSHAINECPTLKARTVKKIIDQVDQELADALFCVRPCVRKLRYIGCSCGEDKDFCGVTTNEYFNIGDYYESIDFNGATYTIKGYENGKQRIGASYFERIT